LFFLHSSDAQYPGHVTKLQAIALNFTSAGGGSGENSQRGKIVANPFVHVELNTSPIIGGHSGKIMLEDYKCKRDFQKAPGRDAGVTASSPTKT